MHKKNHDENTLTQFSTMNALVVGLYDGAFPVSTICRHGDLGLGCSHGIDGEMIVSEGRCYVARAGEPIQPMLPIDRVPFAQVAHFYPDGTVPIADVGDKDALTARLLELARTRNLYIGFRVEGQFRSMTIRQPPPQQVKPYPPLNEAMKGQTMLELQQVEGVLVGFWTPSQYQGLSIAGIHIHFLDSERRQGGHVLDVDIEHGTLAYQVFQTFTVKFPDNEAFRHAELDYKELDAHIRDTEG